VRFQLSENFLNDNLINSIGNNAKKIVEIARQGNIPYIRIYDPLPPFPKFNIFGVDYPFNRIWGQHGFNLINQLNFKSILDEANNHFLRNDLDSVSLARIHWNGYSSYRGLWHRDGLHCDNDTNDIICVLYLLKESGFKVIPEENEHLLKNYNYPEITSSIQPNNSQNAINIDHLAYKVTAKAGDLFMFNSGLLHKGVVDGPRLHIHMRLTSSKSPSNYFLSQSFAKFKGINLCEELFPTYKLSKKQIPIRTYLLKKSNLKNVLTYLKRFITYVIPFPSKEFLRYIFLRKNICQIPKYNIKGTLIHYLISLVKK
tara:strand:+ start:2172 stop:3113 length:942 start_codon:yes stop_codon:yes gene_type:complete